MGVDLLVGLAALGILIVQAVLVLHHRDSGWRAWFVITCIAGVLMAALLVSYAHWLDAPRRAAPLESEAPR